MRTGLEIICRVRIAKEAVIPPVSRIGLGIRPSLIAPFGKFLSKDFLSHHFLTQILSRYRYRSQPR